MHTEPLKKHNMLNKRMRMRVCSPLLKLRNGIVPMYLLQAIRPQKSPGENYAKHDRTNEINSVRQTLSCFLNFQKKLC